MNADDYNDLNELISAAVADLSVKLAPPDPVLSKREWFAGLAMQGLLTCDDTFPIDHHHVADQSVQAADALLARLAKDPNP